jgi:hypothetical protein
MVHKLFSEYSFGDRVARVHLSVYKAEVRSDSPMDNKESCHSTFRDQQIHRFEYQHKEIHLEFQSILIAQFI